MDQALYRKYSQPGPRYTSYPTVPEWTDSPSAVQWLECLRRALTEGETRGGAAALYVHIPFCESLCTFCGCNTRISRNHNISEPYIETLLAEWRLYLERLDRKNVRLGQVYLGGGTPTFLSPGELDRLVGGILEGATLADGAELAVEADPRVTRLEHLETLRRHGFRQLSLGVQDLDPQVQETVHRVQSEEQVRELSEQARELGFESIGFDLIYGLPRQARGGVEATLAAVRRLRPDRVAYYSYAHVPWIKQSHRGFTEADLPSPEQKRSLYELGRGLLEELGYREIGMNHFALASDSLWKAAQAGTLHRNFMGYSARSTSPLIGLGVSAIGDSWTACAQNEKVVETYQKRVEDGELPIHRGHLLTEEDLELRGHIFGLMTNFETTLPSLGGPTALTDAFLGTLEKRLGDLAQDGLIELEGGKLRVTERGRPFLRSICMAFDARAVRGS